MSVGLFVMISFVALLLILSGVSYGVSVPVLTFRRHGQVKDESDESVRNVVDLNCREGDRNMEAFFWNGNIQLNSVATSTYTHILTPATEAIIVCKNLNGIASNRIKLAGLPNDYGYNYT